MNISRSESDFDYVMDMDNFLNESTNQPTMIFSGDSEFVKNKTLTIDMKFNSGHVLSISVYTILFILSAGGNITVLTAILRQKRTESLSRIDFLLMHLAVADLMVTFFMMPLEIIWAATVDWRAGDVMCRIMSFLRIFGLYLSGFVLVCLAIDRYLAVRYPMQALSSTKRAKIMVVSAWILSSLCSFPQVLIFHVESHPDFPWYTQCVAFNAFPKPEYELMYRIFGMIMMYALPLILLAGLYGSIAIELYKISHSTSNSFQAPDGLRRTGGENIERAKVKSIQMTFVITAAFLVCWTPYYVMCIWYWIDPETAKTVDQRIQKGLFLFACTNSAVNPIVYGIFNMKSIFGRNMAQSRSMRSTMATTPSYRTRRTEFFSQDDGNSLRRSNSFNNSCRANETRVDITGKQSTPLVINESEGRLESSNMV